MIYELYTVLIHKGTATSGHYFAFIKDVEDNKWYKFNDSQVTTLDLVDLVKAFGSKPQTRKTWFSGGEPSENAYMLMYRLKQEGNINVINDE